MARLTPEAKQLIENRSNLTNRDLSRIILAELGLKVSHVSVGNYKNTYQNLTKITKPKIAPKPIIRKTEAPRSKRTSPKRKQLTFKTFSDFMMEGAVRTGSNSYRKDELVFRRSGLKNIFLVIQRLQEEKML